MLRYCPLPVEGDKSQVVSVSSVFCARVCALLAAYERPEALIVGSGAGPGPFAAVKANVWGKKTCMEKPTLYS